MTTRPTEPIVPSDHNHAVRGNSRPLGDKVLVVEDNRSIAAQMEIALIGAGYLVGPIAVSADEAVAACERLKPNFVLMDVHLAGERNSVSAAIEIYKRFGIRCVFLTGDDDLETRKSAQTANPLAWLGADETRALRDQQIVAADAVINWRRHLRDHTTRQIRIQRCHQSRRNNLTHNLYEHFFEWARCESKPASRFGSRPLRPKYIQRRGPETITHLLQMFAVM